MVFVYHGALYTAIKTTGPISERARATALVEGVITAVGALVLVGATYYFTDLFNSMIATVAFALCIVFFLISWGFTRVRRPGVGFTFSCLSIISVTAAYFAGLFPRIMVSSLNPAWSLTIKKCFVFRIYVDVDDDCSTYLCANRINLPRLDLLDIPSSCKP